MKRLSLALCCLVLGGVAGTYVAAPFLKGETPAAPAIPKELTSYRGIVKGVLPAVVSIEARAKAVRARHRRAPAEGIPPEFRRFFDDPMADEDDDAPGPGTMGFGSGFIVDAKGVILTNNHVVDGADEVIVQLRDGRKFVSKEVKTDPKTDLAIVRINSKEALPFLELGDSSAMDIGDRVLAVGAPFGLTGTVTHGIISAKGRALHMNMYEDFLQTDAAINPGNSGGPLVNLEGKVIGINAAIKSRSGGFQGVGLAIASNLARNVMNQLLTNGTVRRGYLGVQIKDVENADLAKRLGLSQAQGVLITRVFEGSPGGKAGLKNGDIVTELAGKPIKDGHELQTVVAGLPIGKPVDLTVVRDGKTQKLSVTVEEQPSDFGTARVPVPRNPGKDSESVKLGKSGLHGTELTAEQAEDLGYKEGTRGVLITRVDRNSVAYEAGLRPGMVVTKVDKKAATSASAVSDLLGTSALEKGVLLQVQSPRGGTNYVLLKTGATP
jgi:serine protease Do